MMYNGTFPIGGYIYILTMFIIIYDDIVLMKYLYKRIRGYYINREKSRQNLLSLSDNYEVVDGDKVTDVYSLLHRPSRF